MNLIIGKNIKTLRNNHGKTQRELAKDMHVARNTISQWETGKRTPSPDEIRSLSHYFLVTVDEILSPTAIESTDSPIKKDLLISLNILFQLVDALLPYVKDCDHITDENFQIALNLHQSILKAVKRNASIRGDRFVDSINKYIDSWNKNKTIEALANILNLLFLLYSSVLPSKQIEDELQSFIKKGMVKVNFLTKVAATNPTEQNSSLKKLILDEYLPLFYHCISTLKNDPQYYQLADYYMALSYKIGITENSYTKEINNIIGSEMMSYFALSKNPYALRFKSTDLFNE